MKGRVELIEGFIADFEKHCVVLKSNIEEYETKEKGETVIRENADIHGYFNDMDGVIKRLHKELVKSKLKKNQSLKEYVEVVRETNKLISELCKLVKG